jgi:hypothetical protein
MHRAVLSQPSNKSTHKTLCSSLDSLIPHELSATSSRLSIHDFVLVNFSSIPFRACSHRPAKNQPQAVVAMENDSDASPVASFAGDLLGSVDLAQTPRNDDSLLRVLMEISAKLTRLEDKLTPKSVLAAEIEIPEISITKGAQKTTSLVEAEAFDGTEGIDGGDDYLPIFDEVGTRLFCSVL